MNLHYNSPCAIESPRYPGCISQDGVLKTITYDQQFKEAEDETIIQEHETISESDIENIYTDGELSADDFDD